MKNMIIGTAGHVDHGKTTLIKALTGTDTDRLSEEKKRGITIDLGFAYMDLPNGNRAGIVDVPGHEKFIRNMLAGVGGVDLALLVIAANEGIMPQTTEHLEILSLLDINHGIIALTKVDMVEKDWIEMVKEEIKEALQNTFLKDAPIICVSASSGHGIEELKTEIALIEEKIEAKITSGPARLPIDRVFVLEGIGTVVTGTLIEGTINIGDSLTIYPSDTIVKVRSIESHNMNVDRAQAGQRTAIHLTGVKKSDISRGDVLATSGSMQATRIIDSRISVLDNSKKPLQNRTRIRLHNGSGETMGRLILLEDDEVKAGGHALAQILLEDDIAVKAGDHFVIRNYSPMETVGGGVVIDPQPDRHKRFKTDIIETLMAMQMGSDQEIIEQAIIKSGPHMKSIDSALSNIHIDKEVWLSEVKQMEEDGIIISLGESSYIHMSFFENIRDEAAQILKTFHSKNPLIIGMSKEEFRSKLLKGIGVEKKPTEIKNQLRRLEQLLAEEEIIDNMEAVVSLYGREIVFTKEQKLAIDKIIKTYADTGLMPPSNKQLMADFPKSIKAGNLISILVDKGVITKLNQDSNIDSTLLEDSIIKIKDFINKNEGRITLAQCRDIFGISRKYSLAILEYLDREKITKKTGDYRVLV